MFAALEQHRDQLQSLSWKKDGSLLATSSKVMFFLSFFLISLSQAQYCINYFIYTHSPTY